jgi:hypothetical protein
VMLALDFPGSWKEGLPQRLAIAPNLLHTNRAPPVYSLLYARHACYGKHRPCLEVTDELSQSSPRLLSKLVSPRGCGGKRERLLTIWTS